MGTLVLVLRWHLDTARVSAAVAVAALVGGWALAHNPVLLPGLTVREAAAPDNVQTLHVISILAGGLILFRRWRCFSASSCAEPCGSNP